MVTEAVNLKCYCTSGPDSTEEIIMELPWNSPTFYGCDVINQQKNLLHLQSMTEILTRATLMIKNYFEITYTIFYITPLIVSIIKLVRLIFFRPNGLMFDHFSAELADSQQLYFMFYYGLFDQGHHFDIVLTSKCYS